MNNSINLLNATCFLTQLLPAQTSRNKLTTAFRSWHMAAVSWMRCTSKEQETLTSRCITMNCIVHQLCYYWYCGHYFISIAFSDRQAYRKDLWRISDSTRHYRSIDIKCNIAVSEMRNCNELICFTCKHTSIVKCTIFLNVQLYVSSI